MGQSITVGATPLDRVVVFSADRSLTGQDGAAFGSAEEAAAAAGFPAALATRLFTSDPAIDHVYVASSEVVVRRSGDWDPDSIRAAATIIEDLFRFYSEAG
jgi:hypothetical protein